MIEGNKHTIGGIILARMDSRRLPGKALISLMDKPLLQWSIGAFENQKDILPIIATTDRKIDQPIVDKAIELDIAYFRGDTEDIASRVVKCCKKYNLDYFFRINGDSPFVNIFLLKKALEFIDNNEYELITNLINRSYPYGASCELIQAEAFLRKYKLFSRYQREHITDFYYKNLNKITFAELPILDQNHSKMDWTVDTKEDLYRLNRYLEKTSLRNFHKINIEDLIHDFIKYHKAE